MGTLIEDQIGPLTNYRCHPVSVNVTTVKGISRVCDVNKALFVKLLEGFHKWTLDSSVFLSFCSSLNKEQSETHTQTASAHLAYHQQLVAEKLSS